MIRLLVAAGAEVNFVATCLECGDETALTIAAQYGQVEAVESLFQLGADKSHRRFDDLTALDLARQGNYTQVVQLLETK